MKKLFLGLAAAAVLALAAAAVEPRTWSFADATQTLSAPSLLSTRPQFASVAIAEDFAEDPAELEPTESMEESE